MPYHGSAAKELRAIIWFAVYYCCTCKLNYSHAITETLLLKYMRGTDTFFAIDKHKYILAENVLLLALSI